MTFLERAFKVFSRIRAGALKGQNSSLKNHLSTLSVDELLNSNLSKNAQKEIIDKLMNESELRGELKAKNIELKGTQNELKFKEKELALNQKVKDLEIEAIDGMYCQEKVKAMHYMQMLTVRGLIELYETKFQKEIKMKRVSRAEKWKQHLSKAPERFKTFQATGLDKMKYLARLRASLTLNLPRSIPSLIIRGVLSSKPKES